jgi:hypothetical protein
LARDCTRNAGFVSLAEVPEDLFIAGVIVVTMTEDGHFGTRFVSEDIDELPNIEVQLDLGSTVAAAWAAASTAEADATA